VAGGLRRTGSRVDAETLTQAWQTCVGAADRYRAEGLPEKTFLEIARMLGISPNTRRAGTGTEWRNFDIFWESDDMNEAYEHARTHWKRDERLRPAPATQDLKRRVLAPRCKPGTAPNPRRTASLDLAAPAAGRLGGPDARPGPRLGYAAGASWRRGAPGRCRVEEARLPVGRSWGWTCRGGWRRWAGSAPEVVGRAVRGYRETSWICWMS